MQKQLSTSVHKNGSFKTSRRYEQPTISTKSRSPSPYTNRRMCELSEDSKQRLAHLHLGPYEFKKATESKPPFVVRHPETSSVPDPSMMSTSMRTSLRLEDSSRLPNDLSLLDGYRTSRLRDSSSKMHIDDLQMSLGGSEYREAEREAGSPYRAQFSRSAPSSVQRHPPSPVLTRSSLRERFLSEHGSSVQWEDIHSRVRRILRTHSARQRLNFDKDESRKEPFSGNIRSRISPDKEELQDRSPYKQEKSVHLDDGEYWSEKASAYKGKSHRVIFEESMEKIYKNMYRNALDPHPHRRSHHY